MSTIQSASDAAPASPPAAAPPYYYAPPRQGSGFNLVAGLLLTILLLLLAVVASFFVLFAMLMGWGGRTVGDAGQQAAATIRSASNALGRARQDARDRLDPTHPPREALAYDSEIEEFLKLGVGQGVPGSRSRSTILTTIRSRDDGDRPELSRYAVIHSDLVQPNETRVLGLTVHRDTDPRDDYVYQGEGFRLGGQIYRVNWVSPDRQQIGLVQLRNPDQSNLALKFTYD